MVRPPKPTTDGTAKPAADEPLKSLMPPCIRFFDRVRERLRTTPGNRIDSAVNAAVTDTLGRTLITSGTTLVAVLSLYLFGGTALGGFAFTVMVGIIAGTWSSVFVAAPMAALVGTPSRAKSRGRASAPMAS
jgi:preprotein translocase subunit SecF